MSTALEVTYLPTTSLKPHPKNPRVHTDKQVGQIAQSIEAFGFNVPIPVDDRQNIVAGHGRMLAARKLGWNTVPVIKLNHLTESQYSAFLIADNRLTENSSWDERLLTAPKTVGTYAGPFWLAINAIWRQQPKFQPRRLFP
jgi:ParB-like chromosome segregation protein Spo0J